VGVGGQQGLLFRNGSGGHVSDALLCNTAEGIEIEDKADEVEDAYERFLAGDLTLNNILVTGNVDALDYDGDASDGDDVLDAYAVENGVVSGGTLAGLDAAFNFDANGAMATDPLFLEVGQGSGQTWAYGWTFCDQRGLFATVANVNLPRASEALAVQVYPNPSTSHAFLALDHPTPAAVRIFGISGALVAERLNVMGRVDLPQVTPGTYVIHVASGSASSALRWVVE
jgi:hypothetical protein